MIKLYILYHAAIILQVLWIERLFMVTGLNVQSFRQMYWNLRDFMSILHWTDHELWLIADPPISLIDSFIDWFKLLLVSFHLVLQLR